MSAANDNFWTDDTSVLFTSFWGWSPETWGTVGWSNEQGRSRRDNLLKLLTDPFITVCYVTKNTSRTDPHLKGMIAGFLLVTHEQGDRDKFTHPIEHSLAPKKWRHSLRAIRAFSYLPEYRIRAADFDATLKQRALAVSSQGEVLTDKERINILRYLPYKEVEVYTPTILRVIELESENSKGMVKAGPASKSGYLVSDGTYQLPRQLYALRLEGDIDAFLGYDAEGRNIYKVGLATSPEMRRQGFQRAIPEGAFHWCVDRASESYCKSFDAAVAGEYAMKVRLASCAKHLGGEFYLATEKQMDKAWKLGLAAAKSHRKGI